jgi:hypothetical protein
MGLPSRCCAAPTDAAQSAHIAPDFTESRVDENSSGASDRRQPACRNCGAPALGNFCPQCGQPTFAGPTSVAALLREWRIRYATRQGRPWQTLSRLLFAPGALTVAYRAGQRARYIPPFQLYLAASVIVFAAVQMFSLDLGLTIYGGHGFHLLRASPLPLAEGVDHANRLTPVQIIVGRIDTDAVRRFVAMSSDERFRFFHARRVLSLSYFVLVLVPLFAVILHLCYRNRREDFSTHLVFGLHVHTVLLLALLVDAMLPEILAGVLSTWILAYFIIALKRVYGGSWRESLGRGFAVLALYFGVAFSANLLLVFALLEF